MKTTRRNFFKISGILAGLAVLNPVKLCQAITKPKLLNGKDIILCKYITPNYLLIQREGVVSWDEWKSIANEDMTEGSDDNPEAE